jgi:hypothetical protein
MVVAAAQATDAQVSSIFPTAYFHAIRAEASGELPMVDFQQIVTRFSGFTPSRGGDAVAEYLASRLRDTGLRDVTVEGYPSDGKTFFWTFLGEPAWEADEGTLTMVEPRMERLADFAVHRVVLGRFSTSADVRTEVVDVGAGTRPEDYAGKDVKGKIVLTSGDAQDVHAEAVWRRGARGVVAMRTNDPELPHLVSNPGLGNKTGGRGEIAWQGPNGEPPGFLFGVSQLQGEQLRSLLRRGPVVLHAVVKATTGAGEYKQVEATIPGSDPALKEIWIKSHTNFRNTGGGNNLTGVGATLEIARVLHTLIEKGTLPRPRRTIRFQYSAEHFGSTYQFYKHPERLARPLTFFSVDMTGFNQDKVDGISRVYRTPHSKPHFLSDVAEEFAHTIGRANTSTGRMNPGFDPIFAPTGSRDPFRYVVEDFWAPSDHEEMVEGSIGVASIEYGHPDRYIGTQDDNVDKVDATQMRRSVLLIASTAYYLASLSSPDISRLVPVMTGYAQGRLGRDAARASARVEATSAEAFPVEYREALNILRQALARERVALESLRELDLAPAAQAIVTRAVRQLEAVAAANDQALRDRAATLASERKVTLTEPKPSPAEQQLDLWIATRSDATRGPVNLWRPEYGSIWIAQKTGNTDVLGQVPLTKAGRFVAYEALNFVDGRRTLLDIRDAVSAEYGPLPAADVEQYFRFLERLGVVTLHSSRRTER